MSKGSSSSCVVNGCQASISNKPPGVSFHEFPTDPIIKRRWLTVLDKHCTTVNWPGSKICSQHFEGRFIAYPGKLKTGAVPSIFPITTAMKSSRMADAMPYPKNRVDQLLSKVSQQQLANDIKSTMSLISVPDDYTNCLKDDLTCAPGTPVEAQLWLLIKKQNHLITRLNRSMVQSKKQIEVLQKNVAQTRGPKTETEQNVDSYKYIIKCLQEKQATLEEQIEILTAFEAR